MFVTILFVAFIARYFVKDRDAITAVAKTFRDNVAADFLNVYNAGYIFGLQARETTEEYLPQVQDAYEVARAKFIELFAAATVTASTVKSNIEKGFTLDA